MNPPDKSVKEHSSSGRRFGKKKKKRQAPEVWPFPADLRALWAYVQGDKFSDLSGNWYEKREVYCQHPFLTMRVEELTS